mmetsp:Transcript_15900/g.24075  ORF Transcript_15900/g.24075 Transcript_15900/m.24075 type:complete len:115 (-) Transcript_15900:122-466(-)
MSSNKKDSSSVNSNNDNAVASSSSIQQELQSSSAVSLETILQQVTQGKNKTEEWEKQLATANHSKPNIEQTATNVSVARPQLPPKVISPPRWPVHGTSSSPESNKTRRQGDKDR